MRKSSLIIILSLIFIIVSISFLRLAYFIDYNIAIKSQLGIFFFLEDIRKYIQLTAVQAFLAMEKDTMYSIIEKGLRKKSWRNLIIARILV